MTERGTAMSDLERSMFDYWLDKYEEVAGGPAPAEVAMVFEGMVRLDDEEMGKAIGGEASTE